MGPQRALGDTIIPVGREGPCGSRGRSRSRGAWGRGREGYNPPGVTRRWLPFGGGRNTVLLGGMALWGLGGAAGPGDPGGVEAAVLPRPQLSSWKILRVSGEYHPPGNLRRPGDAVFLGVVLAGGPTILPGVRGATVLALGSWGSWGPRGLPVLGIHGRP